MPQNSHSGISKIFQVACAMDMGSMHIIQIIELMQFVRVNDLDP